MDADTARKYRRFEELASRADRLTATEECEFDILVGVLAKHEIDYRAYRKARHCLTSEPPE